MEISSIYVDIPKRARFYGGILDTASLISGKEVKYRQLPITYIIFITNHDLFGKGKYRYFFQNYDLESNIPLNDGSYKLFLNTKGTDSSGISDTLKQFLKYVDNSSEAITDKKVLEIHKIVQKLKNNEEVEEKYMNLSWAKYEGLEEGKELGLEEGKELGLEVGKELNKIQTIIKMNKRGFDKGQIVDLLESNLDYVEHIIAIMNEHPQADENEIFKIYHDKSLVGK